LQGQDLSQLRATEALDTVHDGSRRNSGKSRCETESIHWNDVAAAELLLGVVHTLAGKVPLK